MVEKAKEAPSGINFDVALGVEAVCRDKDGDPVTTVIVEKAFEVEADARSAKKVTVPPQERLLREMVEQAMIDAGFECHPLPSGPKIKVVSEDAVRERYYARMAEKAEPGELPETVSERQRKAFRRSLNSALRAKRLIAATHAGETVIWHP